MAHNLNLKIVCEGVENEQQNEYVALLFVAEAQKRMYRNKAQYYQSKERRSHKENSKHNIEFKTTGKRKYDSLLSIISIRYHGAVIGFLNYDAVRMQLKEGKDTLWVFENMGYRK